MRPMPPRDVHTIWCRHCRMGFALAKPWPPVCQNAECAQRADWAEESPEPRAAYNLTANDRRWLRSFKIDPE